MQTSTRFGFEQHVVHTASPPSALSMSARTVPASTPSCLHQSAALKLAQRTNPCNPIQKQTCTSRAPNDVFVSVILDYSSIEVQSRVYKVVRSHFVPSAIPPPLRPYGLTTQRVTGRHSPSLLVDTFVCIYTKFLSYGETNGSTHQYTRVSTRREVHGSSNLLECKGDTANHDENKSTPLA